jgi:hypothetical protein
MRRRFASPARSRSSHGPEGSSATDQHGCGEGGGAQRGHRRAMGMARWRLGLARWLGLATRLVAGSRDWRTRTRCGHRVVTVLLRLRLSLLVRISVRLSLRLPVRLWRVLRRAVLGRLSWLLGRSSRLLGVLSRTDRRVDACRCREDRAPCLRPVRCRKRGVSRRITPRRSGARASAALRGPLRAAARDRGAAGGRCGQDRGRSPA